MNLLRTDGTSYRTCLACVGQGVLPQFDARLAPRDALSLAMLYTIRIWIGGAAVGVSISYWLLLFSIFLFLSLAYLKRYIEVRAGADARLLVKGRGYVGGDADLVMVSGVAAGMVAILILALFAHEPEAIAAYAEPDLLLLICLPLLYWLNRIWIMARRGEVLEAVLPAGVRLRLELPGAAGLAGGLQLDWANPRQNRGRP